MGLPEAMSAMTASMAVCWSAVSSNGKPAAKRSYSSVSRRQAKPFAGFPPGVDFEQFGGGVADFLCGLLLGALPLFGP